MDKNRASVLGSGRLTATSEDTTMAKVGDKVPSATLRMMSPDGPKPVTTEELFAPGKKVVAFALPGAFTPT
jgi:peroxiredoxin